MNATRTLGLATTAAVFFALALACGGGPKRAPVQQDETPSLGDLLGAQPPASTAAQTAQAAPTAPVASQMPVLPDLEPPVVAPPVEPPSQVTPECTAARSALRAQREQVDARRTRELASSEQALAQGQLGMQNCIKTSPCNRDAEAMAAAQERAEAAERAYQAAMQRVAAWEAELYPYEQDVDRACGRR